MSNDHISLTPELLLSQAAEMASLRQEYAQMFQQVSKDLGEINGSWSEYLANNFQGKIESVQRGLNNVLGMLDNGSAAARLCVSDLGSLDGTLGKQLGGSGVYDAFKQAFGGSWQGFWDEKKADYEEVMHGVDQFDEVLQEKIHSLPEEQQKLIDELIKKAGLGDAKKVYDIVNMMADGDYGGASQELGKEGLDQFFQTFYDPVTGKVYSDFTFNWTDSTAEAVTEACLHPSFENIAQVGWNMTVKPTLDTCGEYIWSGISIGDVHIPGISEIPGISDFYTERGAHDAASMGNVALTELYRILGGDDAADYVQSYYADHGGVFQGVYDGVVEIGNFVVDQVANGWHSLFG